MTDHREQAIRDVATECDMAMLAMKPSLYEEDHACASFRYAVLQRERVLELERALRELTKSCWFNKQGGGIEVCAPAEAILEQAIETLDMTNREQAIKQMAGAVPKPIDWIEWATTSRIYPYAYAVDTTEKLLAAEARVLELEA